MTSNKLIVSTLCLAVAGLVGFSHIQNKHLRAPLFEDAVDYAAATALPDCTPRNGAQTVYHECLDSGALYASAFADAKTKGQPLIVLFGFDECPACQDLDETLFPESPLTHMDLKDFLSDEANAKIRADKSAPTLSLVRIHIRNENGVALAKDLGALAHATSHGADRLWSPFMIMINPETNTMHTEERFRSGEYHCYGYMSEIATTLEALDYLPSGTLPFTRKMCDD